MTARAEGFWWVRLRGGTVGWEVVRFEYGSLWRMGTAAQIDAEHEVEQWGPYLGKEPGDQNRLPGLSRWGKVSPAGADCTCDWCHRLTESEVNAIEARLRQAEETPTP